MKFDELLKGERINNFLKREYNQKKKEINMGLEPEPEVNPSTKDTNKLKESLKKIESGESLIFEINEGSIEKNKDIILTNNKSKELKSIRKDSLSLEVEDLIIELNKIKNSPEKRKSLNSEEKQNIENHKEILDSFNFENNDNAENCSKLISFFYLF